MKAVMYHYVRPAAPGLPYFPYLALADFERQLDYFEAEYGFVGRDDFAHWARRGPAPAGVLLTFDDGLRDHHDHVLPVLRARGLFGLFYVPSAPVTEGRLLDVHKVHLALGRIGGMATLEWLYAHASDLVTRYEPLDDASSPYAKQKSDAATRLVKSLFNWRVAPEDGGAVLDALLVHAFDGEPPEWRSHYLEAKEIRALAEAGLGIGPHGHRHTIPSLLGSEAQQQEIELSCAFVETVGGGREWGYCYPYGVPYGERTLLASGFPYAFSVGAVDIDAPLSQSPRYALPRHNCNAFPHGSVSFDSQEAPGPRI